MTAMTRYMVIYVRQSASGDPHAFYAVVDTMPSSGVPPVIARGDLSDMVSVRDALNAGGTS